MQQESRVKKSLLNARVNLIFYFITLALSFFSRKIFLDCLGADFMGLIGTLRNLLGFLNIAELGVSAAVAVVLYKPLLKHDKQAINEIISVLGYLYRTIGLVILLGGIILAVFIPLIYPNTNFNFQLIYSVYFVFLTSSLIGYFVNYKQTLLSADQRNYIVAAYTQTANLCKTLLQIFLATYTRNFYLWIIVELMFGVLYAIILNRKIRQSYPWLKSSITEGKQLNRKYPEIIRHTKKLFIHKIGSIFYIQVTPFLIYAYASLQIVSFYDNYTMITTKLSALVFNLLGSTSAGVGNLIAEGNKEKILSIYWQLLSMRFWVVGILAFTLYYMLPPFIHLWLGSTFVLSNTILLLVIISFCLGIIRGVNEEFIFGFGLFSDTWAPFVESFLLIAIAIAGGTLWGFKGVLLGSIMSSLIIIYGWKPYLLFSKGFNVPIRQYWQNVFVHILGFSIAATFVSIIIEKTHIMAQASECWLYWIINGGLILALISIIYSLILLATTKGMRNLCARLLKL